MPTGANLWKFTDAKTSQTVTQKKHCVEYAVGDDGGGVVDDECATIYNHDNIHAIFKHYGTASTPPTKVEGAIEPYVPVEEFEFLKSTFERDYQFRSIWHMKMSPKVIYELTNWVTVHGDPYELFYSNMDDALRFSVHHGETFYEDFRTKVNQVLTQHHQPRLTKTYEDSRSEFLEKFEKF